MWVGLTNPLWLLVVHTPLHPPYGVHLSRAEPRHTFINHLQPSSKNKPSIPSTLLIKYRRILFYSEATMSRTDDNRAESFDEQDPSRDTDGDKKRSRRPASKCSSLLYLIPYYFLFKNPLKLTYCPPRYCFQTTAPKSLAVRIKFDPMATSPLLTRIE